MNNDARIVTIQFMQFKALKQFTLNLHQINILVGQNNSGKSTIIGALRALASGLRIARTKTPSPVDFESGRRLAYNVPEDSLPISLENVHTDYSLDDSQVTFKLSNGNKLHLVFPKDGGCFLVPDAQGYPITSVSIFKRKFPITLTVVPVLGPVEHREQLREKSTIVSGLSTHRASRHFRNYWHYFPEDFDAFAGLVSATWPGMTINPPEIGDKMVGELSMFCIEDRMTRELYWVGFGFQIWCQLLTHLSRARGTSLVVVDEPEVYLHPDIQRQLLAVLRDAGPDVLLATHSTEIMAEADPSELVFIDKNKRSGERLRDVTGVQRALEAVGSVQNITLTALARNRHVLFLEGTDDFRLLRRFARKLGLLELSAGVGITPLESGGFGSWSRITTLAAGIADALGAPLIIGAVYDRDYFCDEEIEKVKSCLSQHLSLAHVHQYKEIENYLLVPSALDRAIKRAVLERVARDGEEIPSLPDTYELLQKLTDPLKDEIQSQIIARRNVFLRANGKDQADITLETIARFTPKWNDLSLRLVLLPGKEVLRMLRDQIQSLLGISLTDSRIIEAMHKDEIAPDLVELLESLEDFRNG
ncbi:ATP-dependent nuclease [Citrifermentans bremense]|uniref:ATP-dependent nuclease n=1 Tax=Citrifermentans bremense TaxID=60035 RepID=UPI0016274685|nr:AAA family ATPase [Citrifermentans bremense]